MNNQLRDNIFLLPRQVEARAKVARRDAVDDMLASYWMYVNNMFCKDSDNYFNKFMEATDTCKQLREET